MASNALECDICYNVFSDENCPRNLPCTHTFCGPCIDRIIVTQMKTCPTCRKEFTATSAEDLMKNRSLLDVVKQLSTSNVKPKIKKIGKKCTKESFQDVEARVLERLKILEEMKNFFPATDALNKMKDGVLNIKKEVVGYKEVLRDIELSIEQILSKITESGDHLEAMTDQMLNEPLHEAPEKVKEIKDLLQKNQIEKDNINKEILKMRRKLEGIADCIKKTSVINPAVEEARSSVKTIGGEQNVVSVWDKPRNQVPPICFSRGRLNREEEDAVPQTIMESIDLSERPVIQALYPALLFQEPSQWPHATDVYGYPGANNYQDQSAISTLASVAGRRFNGRFK